MRKDQVNAVPYLPAMERSPKHAEHRGGGRSLLHSRRQIDWLLRLARIQISTSEASLQRTAGALEQSRRLLDAVLDPAAPIPFRCCSEPAALLDLDSSHPAAADEPAERAACRSCGRSSHHRPLGVHEAVAYRVHLRAMLGAADGDWLAYLVVQFPSIERCCTCDHVELLAACRAYEELGPGSSWLALGVTEQLTLEAEAALDGRDGAKARMRHSG